MVVTDVMIDLETYGLAPNSVIRSVGAVSFDLVSGKIGDEFYLNVDHVSCLKLKMVVDQGTRKWWDEQSEEAKNSLKVDPRPITEVVERFRHWFKMAGGVRVWSQGANFDEPMLSWACVAAGYAAPWKFFNSRDTRTLYDMADFNPRWVKREGTYHNALDDAKHQVECCVQAYRKLKGRLA